MAKSIYYGGAHFTFAIMRNNILRFKNVAYRSHPSIRGSRAVVISVAGSKVVCGACLANSSSFKPLLTLKQWLKSQILQLQCFQIRTVQMGPKRWPFFFRGQGSSELFCWCQRASCWRKGLDIKWWGPLTCVLESATEI